MWRIAARLRLPVLRLAPLKAQHNNCPFLTENHCAIHDAEPLVCALYPLAQEISGEGAVSYFLQPTSWMSLPGRLWMSAGHRPA
ncbi:MAG: hypothetical protein BHW25_09275 [Faecalibacterium sp. CAG:82-related_59_9]|nr:MAG: hypothetical protein BHW25_09275 [Faecalibacterium sp. CAG:82-related_59_9]